MTTATSSTLRPSWLLFVAVAALAAGCGGEDGQPAPDGTAAEDEAEPSAGGPAYGHAWVVFGTDTVVAEVARTPREREQGLMNRSDLPEGTGMLFVFPDEQQRSFWMANTYVPLDIAYLSRDLRIVDIQQMEPEVTDLYPSAAPAMFALEVPQGWFAAHGVTVGDRPTVVFGPL